MASTRTPTEEEYTALEAATNGMLLLFIGRERLRDEGETISLTDADIEATAQDMFDRILANLQDD